MVDYWEHQPAGKRDSLEGLAFSILVALDGECGGLPGFSVKPLPHRSDKRYLKSIGENWYEQTEIAGSLHEVFLDLKKKSNIVQTGE
jgi:hypothetical protein